MCECSSKLWVMNQMNEENPQQKTREKVFRYYKASTDDYLTWYQSDWHHHMHYGFERDLPKGGNPTENLVRYMAEKAEISEGTRVLDSGCGVGGASIWLAEHKKANCVGLNLMEMQLKLARVFSQRHGTLGRTEFVAGDFTKLPLKEESFDVIWATESYCHATDKKTWIQNMYRLLKPGGRLIVADGFRSDERTFSASEEKKYHQFISGWAVPNLSSQAEHIAWCKEAGFLTVDDEDISADVEVHAKSIFRFGLLFIPIRWALLHLGLTSLEKFGNAVATYHQYTTFKRKLWTYRVIVSRKD